MKKILVPLAVTIVLIIHQTFASLTIQSVSVENVNGCQEGRLVLSDGTIWGWSPYFEDEKRVLGWEQKDQVFIAPFPSDKGLSMTLFNLTREKAPEEIAVNGVPYYIQPEVAPIFIWPKSGSPFFEITDMITDAGWVYTDLYFKISNGVCYFADSGQMKQTWQVGDKVFFSQLSPDNTLHLINITRAESIFQMKEADAQIIDHAISNEDQN